MIPLKYVCQNGESRVADIDSLVDVVRGSSGKRRGWRALIAYVPDEGIFLELRDAPPDVRGESLSETEEVALSYVQETFGLTSEEVVQLQNSPHEWIFEERFRQS